MAQAALAYGDQANCDVLLYVGDVDSAGYERLRESLPGEAARRKNVLMILVTWGGDANAAYRIGRGLQRRYQEVRVLVPGPCKSAGTLLAIAAHELIVADDGELGPIDVQRMRQDDLWERSSGLIENSALESLGQVTWDTFERLVTEIKDMSLGRITFKTAAEAAAPIVTGVLSPIAAQIDPLKVGETARALEIASQYARLLSKTSRNLRRMSIDRLATSYPDHGFIIDREEAGTLFNRVSEPTDHLRELTVGLGDLDPGRTATIFLNTQKLTEPSNEETQSGTEAETDGIAKADPATSTNGNVADAPEDQAADRANGTKADGAGN